MAVKELEALKIQVHQVVGDHCVTVAEGWRLYRLLIADLRAGQEVELDFAGVQVFGSAFFNASLGYLLRDFEVEKLRRLVTVSHLQLEAQVALRRVVENCNCIYQRSNVKPTRKNPMVKGG